MSDDELEGPGIEDGIACPECGATASKNGRPFTLKTLDGHRTQKHGIPGPKKEVPPAGVPGTPGRRSQREKNLTASLAVLYSGVSVINRYDGTVLLQYAPDQAHAFAMCAEEYAWAKTVCDMLEMSGPIALLASSFVPPLILILANHGILPSAAAGAAGAFGGGPMPPSPSTAGAPPNGDVNYVHSTGDPFSGPTVVNVADGTGHSAA